MNEASDNVQVNEFPPDLTEGQILSYSNQISEIVAGLVVSAGVVSKSPFAVPVELNGNSTMLRFKRIPEGYKLLTGTRAFNATPREFYTRVFHEFVHIINDIGYIDDTCGGGNYHTEEFKTMVEKLGGTATWTKGTGYAKANAPQADAYQSDSWILPKNSALIIKPKEVKPKSDKPKGGFIAPVYKIDNPSGSTTLYVQKDQLVDVDVYNKYTERQQGMEARKLAREQARAIALEQENAQIEDNEALVPNVTTFDSSILE